VELTQFFRAGNLRNQYNEHLVYLSHVIFRFQYMNHC
jgi:hypothetical protein